MTEFAPALEKGAKAGSGPAADRPPPDHAPALEGFGQAMAASRLMQSSPQTQLTAQRRRMLDGSPRVRALREIGRALNPPATEPAAAGRPAVVQGYFLVRGSKTPDKRVTNIGFLPDEWGIPGEAVAPVRKILLQWAKDDQPHEVDDGSDAIRMAYETLQKSGAEESGPSLPFLCLKADRTGDPSPLFGLIRKLSTRSRPMKA